MRQHSLMSMISTLGLLMMTSVVQAASPLWTLTPLTPTTISVANNATATVSYLVTNQSLKTHTLAMQPIKGVTPLATVFAPNTCTNPFVLAGRASCVLSLQIDGSQTNSKIQDGPIVCQVGSSLQCYRPSAANILNVTVTGAPANTTTLTASVSDLALAANGIARIITITNTGSNPADNLMIDFPAWPAGTTATSTCSSSLSAASSCTITITPGASPTSACNSGTGSEPTPGVIAISADNANTTNVDVVVLTTLCIYQKGYLFEIDDTTPNTASIGGVVASLTDVGNVQWSPTLTVTGATDLVNGSSNTAAITATFNAGSYAAYTCSTYTIDSAGNSPCATGTCYSNWYLPAVCQAGAAGEQANCPSGLPNMETNLAALISGCVGAQCLANTYWTSTEFVTTPAPFARTQFFDAGGGSQFNSTKTNNALVRCVRSLA